jgi:hypothetical protein
MADGALYFAVKSIGMSTRCGRKPQTLLDAARHNLREIQAEHGADGHIDPKRIAQNAVMRGPLTAAEVLRAADELFAGAGVETDNLRKDYCQAIELVFSLPVGSDVDAAAYFELCLRWTDKEYALPVLLATAHHDEAAKHLHVLLLPLQSGAYVGSAPVAIPVTTKRRESFFQKVAGPHGLKRSNAKLYGMVKTWGIQAVLARIEAVGLPECAEALWPTLREAIQRDPTSAMRELQIDINSIRPQPIPTETNRPAKAIGFASHTASPIGFRSISASDQNLSCVGFTEQKALRDLKATPWGTVQESERGLSVAGCSPMDASTNSPTTMKDEDGIVRERGGFCQVPDAWMD